MSMIRCRTILGISTYASVVTSPATTTSPVVTRRLDRHPAVRVLAQQRVQHRVADLVGDLVRMTLGHRLGGEQSVLPWPSYFLACVCVRGARRSNLPAGARRRAHPRCDAPAMSLLPAIGPSRHRRQSAG